MRLMAPLLAVFLLAPFAAQAQAWQQYNYSDAGFSAQFPGAPSIVEGTYKTASGTSVPAKIYSAREDNVVYTITVADFSNTALDNSGAIDDAVKVFGATGDIKADVNERVNQQHGRELSITGKDGSHSTTAIFFFNHRLYVLDGKALPPNAESQSGNTLRFQQSLQFAMFGGQFGGAPGENANDAGPGGPGGGFGRGGFGAGRRGGFAGGNPPPEAFDACKGKNAGDTVQETTPNGDRHPAVCTQTPRGLLARLDRRPPPEAFNACQGKKEGDAVQLDTPRGALDSTCVQTPEGLAARPNNRPGRDGLPGRPGIGPGNPPNG
jgi:hypothetical protein